MPQALIPLTIVYGLPILLVLAVVTVLLLSRRDASKPSTPSRAPWGGTIQLGRSTQTQFRTQPDLGWITPTLVGLLIAAVLMGTFYTAANWADQRDRRCWEYDDRGRKQGYEYDKEGC